MTFQTEFSPEEIQLNRKLVLEQLETHESQHYQGLFLINEQLGVYSHSARTIQELASNCYTRACIAGWAVLMTVPHDVTIKQFYKYAGSIEDYAAKALGLSSHRASSIFYEFNNQAAIRKLRAVTEGNYCS